MKKNMKGIIVALFMLITGVMAGSLSVHAATHAIHSYAYTNKGRIFYQDLDGNGKKDKIQVTPYKNSSGLKKFVIKVNGKEALSYLNSSYFKSYNIRFFSLDNKQRYMQFVGKNANNKVTLNLFVRYNKSTKKFMIAKNFMTTRLVENTAMEVVKAVGNNIYVRHRLQPIETGYIYWDYIYSYTNGSFKLKNTSATAKSCIASKNDKYQNYFKSSKYVTAKKIALYTDSTCRRTAMVVPKGKTITLKNVKITSGKVYLRFQYGNKYGWQRVKRSSKSDWFYGVKTRLAA